MTKESDEDAFDSYIHLARKATDSRRYHEAIDYLKKAMELEPTYARKALELGILQLLTGNYKEGWNYYSARLQFGKYTKNLPRNVHIWNGKEDIRDKKIWITTEQGRGDTIQFSRYVPLLEQKTGAKVYFFGTTELYDLFKSSELTKYLLKNGDTIKNLDCCFPLMELPRIFGTTLETIPAEIPYLKSSPEVLEKWAKTFKEPANNKLRVGIVWGGNVDGPADKERSIDAALFKPLTQMNDIDFYSLQVGRDDDFAKLQSDSVVDLSSHLTDYAQTAAAINQLDLVITVDTSVAHLAGALGVHTWVLLPLVPDWRWLLDRDDSPWYPSIRLFRQEKAGDWQAVLKKVQKALKGFFNPSSQTSVNETGGKGD